MPVGPSEVDMASGKVDLDSVPVSPFYRDVVSIPVSHSYRGAVSLHDSVS